MGLYRTGSHAPLGSISAVATSLQKRSPLYRLMSERTLAIGRAKRFRAEMLVRNQDLLDESIRACLQETDVDGMVDLLTESFSSGTPPLPNTIQTAMTLFARVPASDRQGLLKVHQALFEHGLLTEKLAKSELSLCNDQSLQDLMLELCRGVPGKIWTPEFCAFVAARFQYIWGRDWVWRALEFYTEHKVELLEETIQVVLQMVSVAKLGAASREIQLYLLDLCSKRYSDALSIVTLFRECPNALLERPDVVARACALCIETPGDKRAEPILELTEKMGLWDGVCDRLIEHFSTDLPKLLAFLTSKAPNQIRSKKTQEVLLRALQDSPHIPRQRKLDVFSDLINASPAFLDLAFERAIESSTGKNTEPLLKDRRGGAEPRRPPKPAPHPRDPRERPIFDPPRPVPYRPQDRFAVNGKGHHHEGEHAQHGPGPAQFTGRQVHQRTPGLQPPPSHPGPPPQPPDPLLATLDARVARAFIPLRHLLPPRLPPLVPFLLRDLDPAECERVMRSLRRDIEHDPELAQSRRSREKELLARLHHAFQRQLRLARMTVGTKAPLEGEEVGGLLDKRGRIKIPPRGSFSSFKWGQT